MEEYPLVYRCAIVVKPLQPFLDWLIRIESDNDQSLTELQEDSNLYLIPDYEDVKDIEKAIAKYIKTNYTGIFVHQLSECVSSYLPPFGHSRKFKQPEKPASNEPLIVLRFFLQREGLPPPLPRLRRSLLGES